MKITFKVEALTYNYVLLFFVTVPFINCGDIKDNQFMAPCTTSANEPGFKLWN